MLWLLLALIAHAGNAFVFTIDKGLLGTKSTISNPARFAAYSSLLASLSFVLLAFAFIPPTGFIVAWSLLSGLFWVLALWLFYTSLKSGEASRVVPLVGSMVPVATLVLELFFLGQTLTTIHLVAAACLVLGGTLLSIDILNQQHSSGLPWPIIAAIILSGSAFAAHFVAVKYLYDNVQPFLAAFAYSRLGVAAIAIALLGLAWPRTRKKPRAKLKNSRQERKIFTRLALIFIGSKVLAAVMFFLQNLALDLSDSVTLVNALQGTQYVFVLILAILVSIFWPKVFREELTRVTIGQKISGIALVVVGVVLIV